jgi:hypothetical protein
MMQGMITDNQRTFVENLLTARLGTLGFTNVREAADALHLDQMSKNDASVIIGRLKAMPIDPDPEMPTIVANSPRSGKGNRPGACATCGHPVASNTGFYYLDNTSRWAVHHKVGECATTPPPVKTQVAVGYYKCEDKIVQVYRTGNGRLAGKVLTTGGGFVYMQGATRMVENGGVLLTNEELPNAMCQAMYGVDLGSEALREMASKFGVTHGNCMFCRNDLTDDRSNPAQGGVGYGPTCAKKFGLPWGVKP